MSTPELAGAKKSRKSFTAAFKQNVVNFYNVCKSKRKTAEAFKIDRASVILWVKKATDIGRKVDGRPSALSCLPVQLTVDPQSRRLLWREQQGAEKVPTFVDACTWIVNAWKE
jgi:transposase-like protein